MAMAVLLGVAVPGVASAGAFKCENWWLYEDDEIRLRAAALRALPKHVHLDEVGPCRNPDSAHAWTSTKKVASIEGVGQWYEFTCRRDAQWWICDPPEFRQSINLMLPVRGASRLVALSFDREFSLSRARELAQTALEIYGDPSARLPQCENGGVKKSDLVDLRNDQLPSTDKPTEVRVSHEGLAESAWLPDVFVSIQFPTAADGSSTAEEMCWNIVIVLA
jgi:hypothetical protein